MRAGAHRLGGFAGALALALLAAAPGLGAEPGGHAPPELAALLDALGRAPDARAARGAARPIQQLGGAARGAAPELLRMVLEDPGHRVGAAFRTLELVVPGDPRIETALRVMLEDGDPGSGRRGVALRAIAERYQKATWSAPTLIGLLSSEETVWRRGAARALGAIALATGVEADAAVAALAAALDDSQRDVRRNAVTALRSYGPRAAPVVPALLAQLSGDVEFDGVVLDTLARIGPGAHEALPAVRERVDHADARIRAAALYAVARIGPPETALPLLVRGLERERGATRAAAAHGLAALGHAAAPALPALGEALRDSAIRDRRPYLEAARAAGPPALPVLESALEAGGEGWWVAKLRRAIAELETVPASIPDA